ncbi:MAG TPA: alpha amylase C-terminal domain-containing protein, partial [Streptosporangiaceae bacterium]
GGDPAGGDPAGGDPAGGDPAGGDPAGGDPAGGVVACIVNFSAEPHERYRVGLPRAGRWRELLNTDAAIYGGSDVGNLGGVEAIDEPWHGMPASALLTLPPLGMLWLAPES